MKGESNIEENKEKNSSSNNQKEYNSDCQAMRFILTKVSSPKFIDKKNTSCSSGVINKNPKFILTDYSVNNNIKETINARPKSEIEIPKKIKFIICDQTKEYKETNKQLENNKKVDLKNYPLFSSENKEYNNNMSLYKILKVNDILENYTQKKLEVENGFNAKKIEVENGYNAKKIEAESSYNSKKNEMENEYNAKKNEIENEYNAKKNEMENEYNAKKNEIENAYNSKKNEIENTYNSKKNELEKNYKDQKVIIKSQLINALIQKQEQFKSAMNGLMQIQFIYEFDDKEGIKEVENMFKEYNQDNIETNNIGLREGTNNNENGLIPKGNESESKKNEENQEVEEKEKNEELEEKKTKISMIDRKRKRNPFDNNNN